MGWLKSAWSKPSVFKIYSVPDRIQQMISDFKKDFNATAPEGRHVIVKKATFPSKEKVSWHISTIK